MQHRGGTNKTNGDREQLALEVEEGVSGIALGE